jgi:glyoxylase-like metal-dependent hydrolase (beta-lactamase superfamily II)
MIKLTHLDGLTRIDSARTLLGGGYYWTTCYLLDDLLIDTGCAHTAQELAGALHSQSLSAVANTHTHEDHIGANGLLQSRHVGLRIYAHPLALPILENPHLAQPLHPYRKLFWGWPTPSAARPLFDGERIQTRNFCLQAVFTPGHSPDHLCFFEEQRGWLFSGDLFNGSRDRALRVGYDIWEIIASLKRAAALPVKVLYPGCARVRENARQVLQDKIDYLEEKGEQVLALYQKGMSVPAIARSVFGGPMLVEPLTLGHFSRRRLVLAYLHKNQDE